MKSGSRVIRLRIMFDGLVVMASILAGVLTGIYFTVIIIISLIFIGVPLTYIEYQRAKIQPEGKALQAVIEEHVLPDLIQDYQEAHPDPDNCPEIRANVMLLRRRNVLPFGQNRNDVRPWQKTLTIEAAYGDYETTSEDELEWKRNEGAVGRAMNERAQEVWATLGYDDRERLLVGWNLTEAQASRTDHLNSLLCVPIYLSNDEEKVNPIGVLNLDSRASLSESQFSDENVRQKVINSANIIGAIVE